ARAKKAKKSKPENVDSIPSSNLANPPEDAESMMDASAEMYTSKGRENRAKIKSQQPALLLAHKYDAEKTDPSGYWVSEKLDGIRTFWDHERGQFFSRLGNPFTAPDWFKEAMPKHLSLDGELFAGRGKFVETISVVKTINSPDWEKVEYRIFDSPSMTELTFEARMDQLKQVVSSSNSKHLKLLPQERVESKEHVEKLLKQIESKGGEGLMLRKPGSLYVGKRSSTLLKVKSFYDAEAVVIAHEPGRGKNSRVTGSLRCRMESGKEFRIGTGLSDSDREAPPKIGAIVTYRFQELTRDGIPRFPSFVGERVDADSASDATVRIEKVKNKDHVTNLLAQVESKAFTTREAIVIGYEAGKGRNARVAGSLKCKMQSGNEFKIATGLSDAERKKPPVIGVIVTYRFQELTTDGVPRFPSYVGVRVDADKPCNAKVRAVTKQGDH
ncbi:hypothetical protein HDU80_010813, partial [Chytriomyces hyalinus]